MLRHDSIGISSSLHELRSPRVNIVHVPRPEVRQRLLLLDDAADAADAARRPPLAALVRRPAPPPHGVSATLRRGRAEEAAERLADAVDARTPRGAALQRRLYADVLELSGALFEALAEAEGGRRRGFFGGGGSSSSSSSSSWSSSSSSSGAQRQQQVKPLRAKLEVVPAQSCPRWHADSVGARALVTYDGRGTLFAANRFAKRRWVAVGGGGSGEDGEEGGEGGGGGPALVAAVAGVDEAGAREAGAGDILVLKVAARVIVHVYAAVAVAVAAVGAASVCAPCSVSPVQCQR